MPRRRIPRLADDYTNLAESSVALAEIVAAAVLCGEISLGSAIVAGEWVAAHERLGRNRP